MRAIICECNISLKLKFLYFFFLFYRLNFHGDELHPLGGAELGAELGAQVSYMAELGGP